MNKDELAIILLDSFSYLTYRKKEKILNLFSRPSDIFDKKIFDSKTDGFLKIFDEQELKIFSLNITLDDAKEKLKEIEKENVSVVTICSSNYPQSLKNIDCPPFVLYLLGDENLLNTECFGIVGTRRITNYGKVVTEKFARELSSVGFTIVSGLAQGVDSCAHKATVDSNGKTIAVIAGGVKNIYPATNIPLAREIVSKGGLILGEHAPNVKPESYMFPIRNRIISGLSRGILITEALEKSGVLHTKDYALDYGKDVFAVPGSILNIASACPNRLISNGEAKAVIDVKDILDEYNIQYVEAKEEKLDVNDNEKLVIDALKEGEKSFDEIAEKTKLDARTLSTLLTLLSIRGIIKKLAGNRYCFLQK